MKTLRRSVLARSFKQGRSAFDHFGGDLTASGVFVATAIDVLGPKIWVTSCKVELWDMSADSCDG